MDYSQTILGTLSGVPQLATFVSNWKLLFFGTAVPLCMQNVFKYGMMVYLHVPNHLMREIGTIYKMVARWCFTCH